MTPISSSSPARSFFQHAFPHKRSALSHWRKRLGEKLELLLAESLRVAHEAGGALRTSDLKRSRSTPPCSPKAITLMIKWLTRHPGMSRNFRRAAFLTILEPSDARQVTSDAAAEM
jgi:hypothetical protein